MSLIIEVTDNSANIFKKYSAVQSLTAGVVNTIATGLTLKPRIVQMYDSAGNQISGLIPEIYFNGTTYDIRVTPGATLNNVTFNVLTW
jgi:hypothetical protein